MLGNYLRDLPASASTGAARTNAPFSLNDVPVHVPPPFHQEAVEPSLDEPEEFEVVMGRLQIASVAFVVVVTLTIFSTVSYLAGRWTGSKTSTNSSLVHAASPIDPST